MAERFKVEPDEEVLFKGPLTYSKSKWGVDSCQGVLTTKRLALGKKLNPMWSVIPRLFVWIVGRKIVFEIPLDQFHSIRNDPKEMGAFFILRTVDGAEYPINSDAFIGKSNKDWIGAITDAVRSARPAIRETETSIEFFPAGGDIGTRRDTGPRGSSALPPTPGLAETTLTRPAPQAAAQSGAGWKTEKILLVAIAALTLFGVIVVVGAMIWLSGRPPKPPEGMVYVPGAEFTMGRDDEDDYERPAHKVRVASFFIDQYEVTNDEFRVCLRARVCRSQWTNWDRKEFHPDLTYPSEMSGRQPVSVAYPGGPAGYCEWKGKRLPTEEEWELAARGTDGRRYPWGNNWKPGLANADGASSGLAEVGVFKGTSPYGAYDMAGNAGEWTTATVAPYPGANWKEIYVWLADDRLSAYHLTAEQVTAALHDHKLDVMKIQDAGLKGITPTDSVLVVLWKSAEEPTSAALNSLVVGKHNAYLIKLGDLGYVELHKNRVIRGGSFADSRDKVTTTYRQSLGISENASGTAGFRCVVTAPK